MNDPFVGRDLMGYKVIRQLGRGAMGTVYLAEQLSLGRKVALKVLDSRYSRDTTYIERFEREARAAASLTHYNVVQVYAFGRDEKDDLYYIVNEYIDGGSVQEKIDADGSIAPDTAVDMILQAARGLEAADAQGLVHRDIKPENLMLTTSGAVKVADFGLAKISTDNNSGVTQSGMIVGTPYYMSPEQAKGISLDIRSDIYSLGITFFHMITGQIPFDADSVIGVLLKQISAERPDPVSINPAVPDEVGQMVIKMMARDPSNRPQTPAELVQALGTLQRKMQDSGQDDVQDVESATDANKTEVSGRGTRYKKLRSSQVLKIAGRRVPEKLLRKMKETSTGDNGVFLEGQHAYNENDVVDVFFRVPGRKGCFAAVGLVRWKSRDKNAPGIGMSFLKVSPVQNVPGAVEASRPENAPALQRLNAPEILEILTRSPLHCRLLRYYYANVNQKVTVRQVANAMGVAVRMLDDPLQDLRKLGLAQLSPDQTVSFFWPENVPLQQCLVDWISEYGLR